MRHENFQITVKSCNADCAVYATHYRSTAVEKTNTCEQGMGRRKGGL